MKLLFILSTSITLTCFVSCGMAPPKSASAEPTPNKWQLYSPPDKTFSVELPCEPTQRDVSASFTPLYEYGCHMEESGDLSFFVILVTKVDLEDPKTRDEAAFERSIKDSFGPHKRLVKLIPIKIEGGIGREVIVTNTRDELDNLRGRVIIFGKHRYEVGFASTDLKLLESPSAERFFATFKPLG